MTDSTGKALPTSEKDATKKGTMAYAIDSLNNNFANCGWNASRVLSGNAIANTQLEFPNAITLQRGGVYILIACVGTISSANIYEIAIYLGTRMTNCIRGSGLLCTAAAIPDESSDIDFRAKITCTQDAGIVSDIRFNYIQAVRIK